ncbi:MAG: phenylalanine--tRNA ligase subunit beta, partial [Pseudomonadota bacterium]
AALAAIGAPAANIAATQTAKGWTAPDWMHPGRVAALTLGPKPLGYFGEIHPRVSAALGVKGVAVGFEIDLGLVPARKAKATRARPAADMPSLQPLRRDFAFIAPAATPAADLVRAARGADKALIADVSVFDIYQGENLGDDEKSVALAVTLQPREASLTDAEIDALSAAVAGAVEKRCGAKLRS